MLLIFAIGKGGDYSVGREEELPYYMITKILIEHGANVNVRDEFDWTPLHYAANEGGLSQPSIRSFLRELKYSNHFPQVVLKSLSFS